jgi:D-alanine-D-alanine ligase
MISNSKRKLRIAVLVHQDLIPPDTLEGHDEKEIQLWRTEFDVNSTLKSMGHEAQPIGLSDDLAPIRKCVEEYRPDVAFNLLEEFDGYPLFDQHVVSYLELHRQKYTGCNPRGLTLAHDKALTKKILAYHRILLPGFAVFPTKHLVRKPNRLKFPLLVKSVTDEGSVGIAQASIVRDDEKLAERVDFIHRQTGRAAMAEEYIEGREIYVGVVGNRRLQTYTPWELVMPKLPDGAANIATGKAKWDLKYQERVGLVTKPADTSVDLQRKFENISKRIYRILGLTGYARIDYRLQDDGQIYMLEVNPNPQIARKEDFAVSAAHRGIEYEGLLNKIIKLGLDYSPKG